MIDAMGMRSSSSGAGMRTGSESTFFLEHAQSTAGSSGEQIPSQLRSIVLNAIAQNLHQSAIFFAEKLIRCSGATPRDAVLYAKTYYGTGEYRRCLAVLEQKGLLSAEAIVALSECLRPSDTVANPNGYHGTVTGKLRDFLSGNDDRRGLSVHITRIGYHLFYPTSPNVIINFVNSCSSSVALSASNGAI